MTPAFLERRRARPRNRGMRRSTYWRRTAPGSRLRPVRGLVGLFLPLLVGGALACARPAPDTPASQPQSPHEALAALDTRTPVPLQPMMAWHQKQNMMSHLVAIQRVVEAAAASDWAAVAEASAGIESSPQMKQMCQHMGAGADGFTERALRFHEQADGIGRAARAQDLSGVLEATSATLKACTTCHAEYRQQVVGAETWRTLTGQAHDPASH